MPLYSAYFHPYFHLFRWWRIYFGKSVWAVRQSMQFLARLQIVFFYVFIILAAIPKKRQQIRDIMERPKDGSNLKSLAAFP